MNKNILPIIFLMILLVLPLVSAAWWDNYDEWDNYKIFEKGQGNKYGIIKIMDRAWFSEDSPTVEVELLENSDNCVISCSAMGISTLSESMPLIDEVRFERVYEDGTREDVDIREYKIYYRTNVKLKKDYGWQEYNGEVLEPGEYNWKIEGKKNPGWTVDWIAMFNGIEAEEWALWQQTELNLGLIAYWDFNNTNTGNLTDIATSKHNGTYTATSEIKQGEPGIIDLAFNFTTQNNKQITVPSSSDFDRSNTNNITISVWLYRRANIAGNAWFIYRSGQSDYGGISESGSDFVYDMECTEGSRRINLGDGLFPLNTWHHLVLTNNGTDSLAYKNSTLMGFTTCTNLAPGNIGYDIGKKGSTPAADFILDEAGVWNRSMSQEEIDLLYNNGAAIMYGSGFSPLPTLNSPVDYYNSSTSLVQFNITSQVYGGANISNVTVYHNASGTLAPNASISFSDSSIVEAIINVSFGDGNYLWTAESCDTDGNCGLAEINRTFEVDLTNPELNITYPINGSTITDEFGVANKLIELNWTVSDINLDSCWYYNQTANVTVTCGDNATFTLPYGTYTHIVYANDSSGNIGSDESTATYEFLVRENNQTYNNESYETDNENFTINIDYTSADWDSISANLVFDSTSYSGTNIGSGDNAIFNRAIDIPQGTGNKTFYWEVSLTNSTDTLVLNSSFNNQTVNSATFSLCNATFNNSYLNFTFGDENDLSSINASIPSSSFLYYLGGGSQNKSFSFTESGENASYSLCFTPSDRSLNVDYDLSYSSTGYPQRDIEETLVLTNATTNQTLYLLSSSVGLYVTFQVLNPGEQPVENVIANVTRSISGSTVLVGSGLTDAAGSITYFLNPNFPHTFTFAKTGFETFVTVITPTQSTYTVTLGGGEGGGEQDNTQGVSYTVRPEQNILNNGTSYEFNYTIASTVFNLDSYGFSLKDENGNIFDSKSDTTQQGGFLSATHDLGSNESIRMEYFWVIDGNYTNLTRSWNVYDESFETDWSIKNLFDDLSIYLTSGMFGLTSFGLAIIIFIFIFVFTGYMTREFGLNSPAAIMAFVFSVVLFLDVGIGIMPNPVGAVEYFPTIFIGLILAGFIVREVSR